MDCNFQISWSPSAKQGLALNVEKTAVFPTIPAYRPMPTFACGFALRQRTRKMTADTVKSQESRVESRKQIPNTRY
jgi:hypothetical protein